MVVICSSGNYTQKRTTRWRKMLSLCHKDVWGVKVQFVAFLTLALNGSGWLASCPGKSHTHYSLDIRLSGPKRQSECGGNEKYPSLCHKLNLSPPAHSQPLNWLSYINTEIIPKHCNL
jgi:hypothetical protein